MAAARSRPCRQHPAWCAAQGWQPAGAVPALFRAGRRWWRAEADPRHRARRPGLVAHRRCAVLRALPERAAGAPAAARAAAAGAVRGLRRRARRAGRTGRR
ncbi:UNVERIFIED_CONTAM: hypothetical protein NCL1_08902 [Trichonephila clavipes]